MPRYVIHDRTRECRDSRYRPLALREVRYVVVHRFDVASIQGIDPMDANAVEACKVMQTHPEVSAVTGGENSYHLIIEPNRIVQPVSLGERGAHARIYNPKSWGVAVLWDPRTHALPEAMGLMLVQVCADLCRVLGGVDGVLYGHDELKDASADPTKQCPGKWVHMPALRAKVLQAIGELTSNPDIGDENKRLGMFGYA